MENEERRFVVDDELKANWAIQKIGEHQRKIRDGETRRDRFIADYQKRIDNTKAICTEYCAEHYRAITSLKESLMEYALEHMPKGKSTMKYPEGNIAFRKIAPKILFADGEEINASSERLINFLTANDPSYLKVKTETKADWIHFKAKLRVDVDTGEIIDKETGEVIKEFKVLSFADKFVVSPIDAGGIFDESADEER